MRRMLDANERRSERRLIIDGGDAGGMWPHFPVLPVKRDWPDGGATEVGVIAWRYLPPGEEDRPVRVYLANFAALAIIAAERAREQGGKVTYAEALEGFEQIEYPTLDAFFGDDWMVD